MAITLTGTGGLFTRIGREGGTLNYVNDSRDSTFTGYLTNIQAQYLATLQDVVTSLFTQGASWNTSQNGFLSYLRTVASDTIIDMVHNDVATTPETLAASMAELIRQMYVQIATIEQPTVSGSVTAGNGVVSNTGTGKGGISVKNGQGVQLDYIYDETITARCTNDAQTGTATAGQETFTFRGEASVSNMLSDQWPLGSGSTGTIVCVQASQEQDESSNLLNNGGFEDFTANLPDNWTKVTGTAVTNIDDTASVVYTGSKALDFIGDAGGTLMDLYQTFDTAGQTTAALQPDTVYLFSVWMKHSNASATGIIRFALKDGTNTIVNDDAGTANSVSVNVNSGLSTTYANTQAFFRTPRTLPSTGIRLQMEFTTALNDTYHVYVDEMTLQETTQAYTNGPYMGVVRGDVNWIAGDQLNFIPTNNYAGAFALVFQRFFNMNSLGLVLPSSGSPSISDSLVA